ncbi:MAG: hypothetical protein ABR520_11140 [Mycobacteriales bacterium]
MAQLELLLPRPPALVAALYVEAGGPYFRMRGVDPWDVERDARTYAGPLPIVAHPPCGPWGCLAHLYQGAEHDCAPAAIAAAREWGGVVEHPERSRLWRALDLPEPDEPADLFGGFTVAVEQCAWGHLARKRSWLYVVGVPRSVVLSGVRTGGTPTHWISGFRSSTSRNPKHYQQNGSAVPPGIKVCSAQQRRRTPPAFAAWLVELAASARRPAVSRAA